MILFLILGIIDIIAGIVLLSSQINIVKYIGLILIWKGIITLFYSFKSKIKSV